jgi:hypothetical protein
MSQRRLRYRPQSSARASLSRKLIYFATTLRLIVTIHASNFNADLRQPLILFIALLLLPAGECRNRMRLEAEAARRVALVAFLRDECGVDLEQDVREGCAEVCAVDRGVAGGLGAVDILAFGAV